MLSSRGRDNREGKRNKEKKKKKKKKKNPTKKKKTTAYLDKAVIAPRIPPAFDPGHVAGQLALLGVLVGPDVAVAADAHHARLEVVAADVQGAGAVDALLEGGGDARELDDPVAPLGPDDALAVASGDALQDLPNEGVVARQVAVGRAVGRRRVDEVGVRRVLLLKVDEALGRPGLLDLAADLHAPAREVAQQIPPLRVELERRVRHARDEAGDVQQVVDLGQVRVGEGAPREAAQHAARGERARRQHRLGHLARRHVVPQEDDALLRQESVHQHDDGVRAGAVGSEVRMDGEGLRRLGVGLREVLDEFDQGEVPYRLGHDGHRHLDGYGDALVHDFTLELVRISRRRVYRLAFEVCISAGPRDPRSLRLATARVEWVVLYAFASVLGYPHLVHLFDLLDEQVLVIAGL